MLHRRVPVWAVLVVVAAVLLLFGIGAAIHSAGWSQGFALGLLAGDGEATALAPYLAYRSGPGWHHGGFGGIFRFFLVLFLAGLFVKFFLRGWMHGPHAPWREHQGWRHQPWTRPEERGQGTTHL